MSTFRKFVSVDEFNAWHAEEKAARGYPLPGRNAKTGDISPLSVGPTTDIVSPVVVDAADVRVDLEGLVQEVKAEDGTVLKELPGAESWKPTYDVDGKVDVVESKKVPVKK